MPHTFGTVNFLYFEKKERICQSVAFGYLLLLNVFSRDSETVPLTDPLSKDPSFETQVHTLAIGCSTTEHQPAPHVSAERKSMPKGFKLTSHPLPNPYSGKWCVSAPMGSHHHILLNLEITLVWRFRGQRFYVIWRNGSRGKKIPIHTGGIVTGNWSVEKQSHSCRNTLPAV